MQSAKIILLGDMGVGKTALVRRLISDRFESDYQKTIGVDVHTYDIELGSNPADDRLRLVLWDTDGNFGQDIFDTIYILGASGAIVLADSSRPATIVKMAQLAQGFQERFPGRPICRVINKIDLTPADRVNAADSADLADVLYVSALTGEGVRELFATLADAVVRRGLQSANRS